MTLFNIKVLIVPAVAMISAAAGGAIEDRTVTVTTLFAVGGVVVPACIWLGREFQKDKDRHEVLNKRLTAIEHQLARLPCQDKHNCPEEK